MVGLGLTPEGQSGNEIMYTLLLEQAWLSKPRLGGPPVPLDTSAYFTKYAASRYGPTRVHPDLNTAWQMLLHTVYNNTNLTSQAVTKSIFELRPNSTGLLDRVGHHPTTINYNTADLVSAWLLFIRAGYDDPDLWESNEAFAYDVADISRQVLANAFPALYRSFLEATTSNDTAIADKIGNRMVTLLYTLDQLLAAAHPSFHLRKWEIDARSWATQSTNNTLHRAASDLLAYNARNQITLWGPTGEISDYGITIMF